MAALGHVLAAPVYSDTALPPFDQSAVDGYAVRHRDIESVPVTLPVRGVIAARGYPKRPALDLGSMTRIFTGGIVPDGADTIVRQEATLPGGDERITVNEAIAFGADIRHAGDELAAGSLVADAGAVVTPGLVGAVATVGAMTLRVRGRPTVEVFVTGDEVVSPDIHGALQLGEVYDSNGPMIAAHMRRWGVGNKVGWSHLRDSEDHVESQLDRAFRGADLVITSGGVSVGDFDFIPAVAKKLGAEVLLHKVAQKPGMPLFVAKRDRCVLIGLPGNPGAVFVNLHVYVRAAFDVMNGLDPRARWRRAPMPAGVRREKDKTFWLRAMVRYDDDGRVRLESLGHQASHMLSNLAAATALVRIPAEGEPAETVEWLPL
jgi:molybdopterin molybdotransferase